MRVLEDLLRWLMKPRTACHLIFLCALAAFPLVASAQQERHVAADLVAVRAEPSRTSEVVGRLRINTRVVVDTTKDGWASVRYRTIQGWIAESLLQDEAVDADSLRQTIATGPESVRLTALERLVALEPGDERAWRDLRAAYAKAKNPAREEDVAKVLEARGVVYFAACEVDGPIVLAKWDPSTGLTRVTGGTPEAIEQARLALGPGTRWFGDSPHRSNETPERPPQPYELAGTPFLDAPTDASLNHIDGQIPTLRLASACTDDAYGDPPSGREASVFFNAPLVVTPDAAAFDWARAGKLTAGLRAIGLEAPVQLRVARAPSVTATTWSVHVHSTGMPAWTLLDADFKPRLCAGAYEECEEGRAIFRTRAPRPHPWGWLAPPFGKNRYAIQIERWGDSSEATGEAGYMIVVVESSGSVHALSITTWQSGC